MFRWVMIVLAACLRRSWAVHGFLQAGQTSEDYGKGPFLPGEAPIRNGSYRLQVGGSGQEEAAFSVTRLTGCRAP